MPLDEKGRCCGRKPLVYRSPMWVSGGPQRYCPRCDSAYGLDDDEQIANWAWKRSSTGEWKCQTNRKVNN